MARLALGLFALVAMMAGCTSDEVAPSSTATTVATASPTADPERVVLEWRREGGIAGFCDGMRVTANHRADLGTCEDPSAEVTGQLLPVDWIGQLEGWRDRVGSFEWEQASPAGTVDGMTVTLRLEGRGTSEASEAERREIAKLAAELFVALRGKSVV